MYTDGAVPRAAERSQRERMAYGLRVGGERTRADGGGGGGGRYCNTSCRARFGRFPESSRSSLRPRQSSAVDRSVRICVHRVPSSADRSVRIRIFRVSADVRFLRVHATPTARCFLIFARRQTAEHCHACLLFRSPVTLRYFRTLFRLRRRHEDRLPPFDLIASGETTSGYSFTVSSIFIFARNWRADAAIGPTTFFPAKTFVRANSCWPSVVPSRHPVAVRNAPRALRRCAFNAPALFLTDESRHRDASPQNDVGVARFTTDCARSVFRTSPVSEGFELVEMWLDIVLQDESQTFVALNRHCDCYGGGGGHCP